MQRSCQACCFPPVFSSSGSPACLRMRKVKVPHGTITGIKIVGNDSIGEDEIKRELKSRVGRDLDVTTIEGDLKKLLETKWFSDVKTSYSKDPTQEDGYILTFTVREAPVLRAVEFRGRKKLKLKDLEEATGLKVGTRADHLRNMLAVNQIKRLYEEKGYLLAEVKLLEGQQGRRHQGHLRNLRRSQDAR